MPELKQVGVGKKEQESKEPATITFKDKAMIWFSVCLYLFDVITDVVNVIDTLQFLDTVETGEQTVVDMQLNYGIIAVFFFVCVKEGMKIGLFMCYYHKLCCAQMTRQEHVAPERSISVALTCMNITIPYLLLTDGGKMMNVLWHVNNSKIGGALRDSLDLYLEDFWMILLVIVRLNNYPTSNPIPYIALVTSILSALKTFYNLFKSFAYCYSVRCQCHAID